MMAINVIIWVLDIFAVILKTFKVPVVLSQKEKKHD
jgi:tellurite resistance protein TehA-like permease